MLISNLDYSTLSHDLSNKGLRFKIGAFNIALRSSIPAIASHIEDLYPYSEIMDENLFVDFYLSVKQISGFRRWIKPQVVFSFDGYKPFAPLPKAQATAAFEWGLNWCVASSSHQYLIIHAAVIEKNGQALILPGSPGSGKSTLCAALIHRGWRLLSDEMVLLSIADGLIYPAPRPVSLKNKSIDIIKEFSPEAFFGERVKGTTKGDIEHMRAPENNVKDVSIGVSAKYLVFPHYESGSKAELATLTKGKASMKLIENSFNFNILGEKGFDAISNLMKPLECYDFTYPDLTQALEGIELLTSKNK